MKRRTPALRQQSSPPLAGCVQQLRTRGLTVLELAVVLSILALLAALLIPAVLSAREANRRITCKKRLADFGTALHAYEAAHGEFPSALPPGPGWRNSTARFISPHASLLPYLDQLALYRKIDFSKNQPTVWNAAQWQPSPGLAAHRDVIGTRIPGFLCPSDRGGVEDQPGNNYRLCIGPGPYHLKSRLSPGGSVGPFTGLSAYRPQDFHDGLSQTVAMSERLTGNWDSESYSRQRDVWYSGISELLGYQPPLDPMVDVCASLTGAPARFYPYAGSTWFIAGYEYTWYNHAVPPNSDTPACSANLLRRFSGPHTNGGVFGASSDHIGGVNCLFMDGAVTFISDDIDLQVWRALSTRKGGEVLDEASWK